eukprot:m.228078 g.228078  ORF g.228078 m.228078 type:complete len:414 (-) comp17393_c0_seq1:187-1428(-)
MVGARPVDEKTLTTRTTNHATNKMAAQERSDSPSSESSAALSLSNLQLHNEQFQEERDWFQFGCGNCKHNWWRKVMRSRPVSKCEKCKEKYDPLPYDQFFGYGRFECTSFKLVKSTKTNKQKKVYCRHAWTSSSNVDNKTKQNCRKCQTMCLPIKIGPPPPVTHEQHFVSGLRSAGAEEFTTVGVASRAKPANAAAPAFAPAPAQPPVVNVFARPGGFRGGSRGRGGAGGYHEDSGMYGSGAFGGMSLAAEQMQQILQEKDRRRKPEAGDFGGMSLAAQQMQQILEERDRRRKPEPGDSQTQGRKLNLTFRASRKHDSTGETISSSGMTQTVTAFHDLKNRFLILPLDDNSDVDEDEGSEGTLGDVDGDFDDTSAEFFEEPAAPPILPLEEFPGLHDALEAQDFTEVSRRRRR